MAGRHLAFGLWPLHDTLSTLKTSIVFESLFLAHSVLINLQSDAQLCFRFIGVVPGNALRLWLQHSLFRVGLGSPPSTLPSCLLSIPAINPCYDQAVYRIAQ